MKVFFFSIPNRYDDYDYGEINQLLDRSFKVYIKTVVCTPEKTTKRMYDSFWRQFEHSEKVQLPCVLRDRSVSPGQPQPPSLSFTQCYWGSAHTQSSHSEASCSQAEIISPFLLHVCWLTADMDWASFEQFGGLDMTMVQLHLTYSQYCLDPTEAEKWCQIIHPLAADPEQLSGWPRVFTVPWSFWHG